MSQTQDSSISSEQRGAIHSTVMAILSIPAYVLTLMAAGRIFETDAGPNAETLEAIGFIFIIFLAWNALGLFLGVRALFSSRAFRPLAMFASTIHLFILVAVLGAAATS